MDFEYRPMFQLGEDKTEYYLLTKDYVSVSEFEGNPILKVAKEGLTAMANAAFRDVSFLLRRAHNEQVAKILRDPEASANDKYVALTFLRNAEVSAKGRLPLCQDTGTAIIHGEKGQQVWTGYCDEEALSLGVFKTYTEENLRYSQNAPLTMYEEVNTKCNLPAQIDIEATEGMEYRFLCVTKGGGSANKTYLYQETKAVLNPDTLVPFMIEKMKSLGTAACPPYHIAFVIGGTSAEKNLLTVKLASTHYYDELPTTGDKSGRAFRDVELEKQVLQEAYKIGLGAQFGGKYMAHDVRIIRLPRHGASCPIGLGVSCSADRNIKCKINREGIWIEKMDDNPGSLIPEELRNAGEGGAVRIDLNQPIQLHWLRAAVFRRRCRITDSAFSHGSDLRDHLRIGSGIVSRIENLSIIHDRDTAQFERFSLLDIFYALRGNYKLKVQVDPVAADPGNPAALAVILPELICIRTLRLRLIISKPYMIVLNELHIIESRLEDHIGVYACLITKLFYSFTESHRIERELRR